MVSPINRSSTIRFMLHWGTWFQNQQCMPR
uniref:Uncharacterized protein n=1 Tax=Arundo donax TaxID=35708 RepID=A0A0A9GV98_ARUDO